MTRILYSYSNPGTVAPLAASVVSASQSTSSLAQYSFEDLNYTLSRSGIIGSFAVNASCLIRIYETDSSRQADTRTYNEAMPTNGVAGLIAEVQADPSNTSSNGNVLFVNGNTPQGELLYFRVFNLDAATQSISLTVKYADFNVAALNAADIGVTIQGYSSVLDTTTASFTTEQETKLAGVEAGATADQTGAEIKTLYEAEANTNAFTDAEQTKLAGIEAGAEVNVNADWNAVGGDAEILNKPTLGTAAATDSTAYATSAQGALADSAVQSADLTAQLSNYESTTQLDARDIANRDRVNHTGTQTISTVTGLQAALDAKAPLASPSLTGTPLAPTATAGTNTTQIATTEFVQSAIDTKINPFTLPAVSTSATINCSQSNYFYCTISSNTTFSFSNVPTSGTAYSLTLEVTHTTGTITWPTSVKWASDTAPTLTTGKVHLFTIVTRDGGTTWRGNFLIDYSS